MGNFTFNPPEGLANKVVFPSDPASEEEARNQHMTLFNQIKDYINENVFKNEFEENTSNAKDYKYYHKDNSTGIIKQGGSIDVTFSGVSDVHVDVTFLKPFPGKVKYIIGNERDNNITTQGIFTIGCSEKDNTKFTLHVTNGASRPVNPNARVRVYWEATGN